MKRLITKNKWIGQETIQRFFTEMQVNRRLRLLPMLAGRKLRRANFKGMRMRAAIQTGMNICILISAILFLRAIIPVLPGNQAAFDQGPIGTFTLTLGGVSIRLGEAWQGVEAVDHLPELA